MNKLLSTRPNGSLSVRLSYEIERGLLKPDHHLERMRALVDSVAYLEVEHERALSKIAELESMMSDK